MVSSSEKKSDPLGRILSYLVALATIIGIPAGLYGYFADQHSERVETTFEFYNRFRSDELQKDWSLLNTRWNNKAQEARTLVQDGKEKELEELVRSLVADEEGSAAIERLLDFFDELLACIENSLCDGNTAYALFHQSASQLAGPFGPYVVFVRNEFGNRVYGTGLFKMRALEKSFSIF